VTLLHKIFSEITFTLEDESTIDFLYKRDAWVLEFHSVRKGDWKYVQHFHSNVELLRFGQLSQVTDAFLELKKKRLTRNVIVRSGEKRVVKCKLGFQMNESKKCGCAQILSL
jgi:hypothetical protein